ncbi:bifunctional DNA primase/polymerase [Corynebacterium pseudopelargi]|uniref:DNA primase/polymerase bifunctional N-terminal domain-containing protein n=1 Tax=Corynebacterium pseudopelargi TaxID=2080757 RepID=A0A3G6ISC6_9CORY|nr:bifunctional DNA primase/polymerase [Corynebacterium pseudopelargi]AZA08502.1 hypothetical protein CPPEL_01780 [Corynebacterium pseudopelargi]
MPTLTMQNHALDLAALGFEVFPLRGKVPAIRGGGGHKAATREMNTIARWWQQMPDANIGARPAEHVLVFDLDPRNGGLFTWEDVNDGHTLPPTITVATGGGGYHYYYRLPYRARLNKTLGAGVDIKAHNGYLVMPPSVHPDTGRTYEFVNLMPLQDIPEVPVWLRPATFRADPPPATITPKYRRGYSADDLIDMVATAPKGGRNNALNRAAFMAARKNIDCFQDLELAAVSNGLAQSEVVATINSAIKAAREVAA